MTAETPVHPPIRTFKARRGRVTTAQQHALDTLWDVYALPGDRGIVDVAAVFGRVAPLVLEIGFGMGETTAALALAQPERDVVAVDVHTPGAGALLAALHAQGSTNVRVVLGDAVELLRDRFAEASLDEVRLFFPDPWPKTRHVKRRMVGPAFAALAASRLRPDGFLHVATDWRPYAEQVLEVVAAEPLLVNDFRDFAPRPPYRPVTRFEAQGLAKGHAVFDVIARRR